MEQWSFTINDFPDLCRPYLVDPSSDPSVGTSEIYAPCCKRKTPADTVVDVRAIEGTVVSGGGAFEPRDHDWLCDGCLHRLYADPTNEWTKSKMLEARGAPAALVHRHRAEEHQGEIVWEMSYGTPWPQIARGFKPRDHEPSQIFEGALIAIEIDHRAAAEAAAFTES